MTIYPRLSCIICATPRTGSTLLCEGLESTQIAGHPQEWFNPDRFPRRSVAEYARHAGLRDYVDTILEAGTTANGVMGAKFLWGQIKPVLDLPHFAGMPLPERVPSLFPNPRYIWITRRHKVRQAVSHWRATQTNQWRLYPGQTPAPARHATFDYRQIGARVRMIIAQEAAWQEYFSACGVTPLTLVYEDLVAEYEATIRRTLAYLDVAVPRDLSIPPTRLRKQADAQSEAWVQQFIERSARRPWLRRALAPVARPIRGAMLGARARRATRGRR